MFEVECRGLCSACFIWKVKGLLSGPGETPSLAPLHDEAQPESSQKPSGNPGTPLFENKFGEGRGEQRSQHTHTTSVSGERHRDTIPYMLHQKR